MPNILQKYKSLPKIRRQSILFGWLLALGIFFTVLALLASIKIIPMKTYWDPEFPFEIDYPEYWSCITRPEGGALVVFISPKTDDMDMFQENVNVTSLDVEKRHPSAEQFATLAVRQLAGVYEENIAIMESRPYTVGRYPGYVIVFAGRKTDTPIKYLIAIFIKGGRAYIITYCAMEQDFDKYMGDVQTMLRSVRAK